MAPGADYFSANEPKKPESERVYHNYSQCPAGKEVTALGLVRPGKGPDGTAYRLCEDCQRLGR
jgi:hypothetical protein